MEMIQKAIKAVESALTQATTLKDEPEAEDVRNGERLGWLLDDLLTARAELLRVQQQKRANAVLEMQQAAKNVIGVHLKGLAEPSGASKNATGKRISAAFARGALEHLEAAKEHLATLTSLIAGMAADLEREDLAAVLSLHHCLLCAEGELTGGLPGEEEGQEDGE